MNICLKIRCIETKCVGEIFNRDDERYCLIRGITQEESHFDERSEENFLNKSVEIFSTSWIEDLSVGEKNIQEV